MKYLFELLPVNILAGVSNFWSFNPFWLCQVYGLCWVTDRVTDRHLNFISTATRYSTMWSINGIKKSARKKIFPVVQPPYFLSSLLGTVDFSFGRNFGRCGRTFSFYSPFEFVSYPICHWFRPFARSRVSFNSKVPICYGAHTESARDREWVRMTERERMLGMRCCTRVSQKRNGWLAAYTRNNFPTLKALCFPVRPFSAFHRDWSDLKLYAAHTVEWGKTKRKREKHQRQ